MDWFWWGLIGLLLVIGLVALVVYLTRPKPAVVPHLLYIPLAEEPPPIVWIPVPEVVELVSPYTPLEDIPRVGRSMRLPRDGTIVGPSITTYEPAGVKELNATLV